jgi:hypothetical protein
MIRSHIFNRRLIWQLQLCARMAYLVELNTAVSYVDYRGCILASDSTAYVPQHSIPLALLSLRELDGVTYYAWDPIWQVGGGYVVIER